MLLKKHLEHLNLTEADFEVHLKNFERRLLEHEYGESLIVSQSGKHLIEKIVKHLHEDNNHLDSDDIVYFPDKYEFTIAEFKAVFSLVTQYLEKDYGYATDCDNYFEHQIMWLKYNEDVLRFFIMWGQGTCTQISIETSNDFSEEAIGNVEDLFQFIEQEHMEREEALSDLKRVDGGE